MTDSLFARLRNAESIPIAEIPVLPVSDFRRAVIEAVERGERISAFFGSSMDRGLLRAIAVVTNDGEGDIGICASDLSGSYEALTPDCPQAHWFEREIAEQWGLEPRAHPWLKPVRFQPRPGGERKDPAACGVTDYFAVSGDEIHEVAVGPVHAGVIEPGHFRFQCYGEEVLHLEISLGYQHRGVERALIGGPDKRTIHYVETLAGDTSVGHAEAYCQAVEAISRRSVPPRGMAIRGIALELERIANHVGDLGALSGDVGFLPAASYCGRIRGDVLNMTALLCGSRFGRGLVTPGGAAFDLIDEDRRELLRRVETAVKEIAVADQLLWNCPSAMARFEATGAIAPDLAETLGLVGPPARASGIDRDVRKDHPSGIYQYAHIPTCTWPTGDVFGRAHIRSIEIRRSLAFVRDQIESLPAGSARAGGEAKLAPDSLAVSLVEGWRGEIAHIALTDSVGRFARYKVVDPSFHNWFGLACAMRGEQISDFPLCNKSFNLSYCGHDL